MNSSKPWSEYVKLNNGLLIPSLGYGTSKVTSSTTILQALETGYNHLDTAVFYKNHREVGEAIRKSQLKRKEIFVTSKVWHTENSRGNYEKVIEDCNNALKDCGLEYFDLLLIHSPHGRQIKQRYKALVDLCKQGKILSYGVSNFGVAHLKALKATGLPNPAVNQIELHPMLQQKDIVTYCQKEGIAIQAYSPLARASKWLMKNKVIKNIAEAHGRSVAQVLIRWSLQKGYICLPKSANPVRMKENFDIIKWRLTGDDMKLIDGLDADKHCLWDPTTIKINM